MNSSDLPPNDKASRVRERPRCGAKRKDGSPCQSTLLGNGGRCRLHGGATLKGMAHPQFKDGKQSKYLYLPERLTPRFEALVGDELANLSENIAIQRTLESTLLEQIDTGESPGAWDRLKVLVYDYRRSGAVYWQRDAIFAEVASIVTEGYDQDSLFARISQSHETQRRLTETLVKSRQTIQETYTAEQWQTLLSIVLRIIINNVHDPAVRQKIQNELIGADKLRPSIDVTPVSR